MADYITKEKKVNGEVVKTTYRVDAGFKPTEIGDICIEFIENWCVANDKIDWLVKKVNTSAYEVKRKNKETGEEYTEVVSCENYPFVNLRRDFVEDFFGSILKKKAAGAETFKDRINRLYGNK